MITTGNVTLSVTTPVTITTLADLNAASSTVFASSIAQPVMTPYVTTSIQYAYTTLPIFTKPVSTMSFENTSWIECAKISKPFRENPKLNRFSKILP